MILLTGHKGLVGSAILNEIPCLVYNKRIDNLKDFSNFIKENRVSTIIHAASKVGGIIANSSNKIDFYLENSKLSNIVFESAYKNNVKTLINLSSTCVFPDKNITYPLTEDQIFQGPPHFSNDAYAYSKRMMQYLCAEARKEGRNFCTLIPCNIYGENDNYNLTNAHVIPALIHKCYLAKLNNEKFIIGGDGSPLREFLYSKDLAKIISNLLDKDLPDSLIVSGDEEYSIKECVQKIVKIMNFNGEIFYDKSFPNGQKRKPSDNSKLKNIINFPFTNFDSGLENSVKWFINNYEDCRK